MRKKFKNFKPYWSEELTTLWRDMASSEKLYRRCKQTSASRNYLYENFKMKQHIFDKSLRQAERKYNRNLADEIEEIKTNDPKSFWDHIKRLGPQKSKEIPMKVYDAPGDIQEDPDIVLNAWQTDFENLYNMPDDQGTHFDEEFLKNAVLSKNRMESTHDNSTGTSHLAYNQPFSMEEINKVCNKVKRGKSVGPDLVPNEILRQ